jgi:hypothetical protein
VSEAITIISSVFSLASFSPRELEILGALDVDATAEFTRAVYRVCKNDPRAAAALQDLLRQALESEITVNDWMRQIALVYQWLAQRQVSAELGDVVQYVACAIEGSNLTAGHTITWYLDQYGFEKSRPLAKPQ